MAAEEKESWLKNLTAISVVVRFLSLAEKLLPVIFSTWNDYLRQKNANLKAELDLERTRDKIRQRIKDRKVSLSSLEYINEYIEKEAKAHAKTD